MKFKVSNKFTEYCPIFLQFTGIGFSYLLHKEHFMILAQEWKYPGRVSFLVNLRKGFYQVL